MLSGRSVIIIAVVVAGLSIMGVVIQLVRPPGSGGMGRDTYGTRARGLRGVYEVLDELHVPVGRGLVPPSASLPAGTCLVFWNPDAAIVEREPGYVRKVAEWVRAGGRAVVCPPPDAPRGFDSRMRRRRNDILSGGPILKELGLGGVSVVAADEISDARHVGPGRQGGRVVQSNGERDIWGRDDWKIARSSSVGVQTEGRYASLRNLVAALRLPEDKRRAIHPSSRPDPSGRILFRTQDGRERTLVASYSVGKGEIVVAGEPTLFINSFIARDDNAVLAAHLLAPDSGGQVIFDEFYHGLTIRGNPAWLLTRHYYGLLAAMLTLASLVWAWRGCVRLGPALQGRAGSRRAVGEYVEAMSSLFSRGKCRKFILNEVKLGVLWALRRRLCLSPGQENVAAISSALARRDVEASLSLIKAVRRVDAVISAGRAPGERDVVMAAREMTECL